jgi:hypothetical protein
MVISLGFGFQGGFCLVHTAYAVSGGFSGPCLPGPGFGQHSNTDFLLLCAGCMRELEYQEGVSSQKEGTCPASADLAKLGFGQAGREQAGRELWEPRRVEPIHVRGPCCHYASGLTRARSYYGAALLFE